MDRFVNVMIQVRSDFAGFDLGTLAAERQAPAFEKAPALPGLRWDASFAPVEIPRVEGEQAAHAGFGPPPTAPPAAGSDYLLRGQVEESALGELAVAASREESTVGVFADPAIQAFLTCAGDPAVGTHRDVERLLGVPSLHAQGLDGSDVLLAVVDTGVDLVRLAAAGKPLSLDGAASWSYAPAATPGSMPAGHGTMCAFDAAIAAPRATLADVVLLRPATIGALLSDAVIAYGHLLRLVRNHGLFEQWRGLVVSNSWGMFPGQDFPPGTPGRYGDNPIHPFNVIVATLERHGADIVFAAGNCGVACSDIRCGGITANTIVGANSHDRVLCVGGVDTNKNLVGFSSHGPGAMARQKPDVCGYTHFAGSGVYPPADSGTSAAAPVVAGLIAAVRSRLRYVAADPTTHPSALRAELIATADKRGLAGHSPQLGWGIADGAALYRSLRAAGLV